METSKGPRQRWVVVICIVVLGAAFWMGSRVHESYREQVHREAARTLESVAELKVQQLVEWRAERLADAGVIRDGPARNERLLRYLNSTSEVNEQEFREWVRVLRRYYLYSRIVLVGRSGREKLADPQEPWLTEADLAEARSVLAGSESRLMKPKLDAAGRAVIDLIAPVGRDVDGTFSGVLILRSDLDRKVLPMLREWPSSSRTAETILVFPDSGELTILNEPRHLRTAPLRSRIRMDQTQRPSVQAALGKQGLIRGLDYRNEPVVAVTRPVAGTDWRLVAKIDLAEIEEPVVRQGWLLLGLGLLLTAAAAGASWALVLGRRATFYRQQYETESERSAKARHYQTLMHLANDAILLMDAECRIIDANERAQTMFGYDRDELLGLSMERICVGTGELSLARVRESALQKGSAGMVYESHERRKDGTIFPVEVSARAFSARGQTYFQSIIRDITERKKAETRIAQLTRLYAVLSRVSRAIAAEQDRQGLFDAVCRAATNDSGFSLAWIGLIDRETGAVTMGGWHGVAMAGFLDMHVSTTDEPKGRGTFGRAVRLGQVAVSNDIATDPGMEYWRDRLLAAGHRSAATVPLRSDGVIIGTFQVLAATPDLFGDEETHLLEQVAAEISRGLERIEQQRRRLAAEEQVAASERRLRAVFEHANEVIFLLDDARVIDCNRAMERVLGYSREQLLTMGPADFSPPAQPDGRNSREEALRRIALAKSGTPQFFEWRHLRADGAIVDVEVSLNPVDVEGKCVLMAIWRDITERKRNEARLRSLSRVIEQSPVSVVITDVLGAIEYVNPKFEQVSGYTFDEVRGQNPRILKSGITPPEVYTDLWRTILGGKEWHGELANKKKSGETYWETVTVAPIKDRDGRTVGYAAVKEDITERKRLEEALTRSQKLEAIGRLAGGIAHDMNNLLTVINGYSEILLAKRELDARAHGLVQEIRGAGQRGETLTKQLLAFSRKQQMDPVVLDLNEVVSNMESMLRRLIGSDVEMVARLAEGLGGVRADRGQIEQVLMNLAVNARDAMPRGGRLLIETREEQVRGVDSGLTVLPGDYVVLEVSDSGCGMDETIRARIFEPFFTTKAEGQGTGLGLAITYGIVKQSGGDVAVFSEPGVGTTFRIYLPRLATAEREAVTAPTAAAASAGAGQTVVVVEDDVAVRALTRAFLEEAGYRVIAVDGPEQALEICLQESEPMDLLLTDVMMPGMSGPDLARKARLRRRGLRVLYMSGLVKSGAEWGAAATSGVDGPVVWKPFTPETLRAQVDAALHAPPPAATVLIADDEPAIRAYFRDVLEERGYRVIEARNGREVNAIISGQQVDLLVTDLVMPDQEGLETLRQLRSGAANLKIIAVSGAAAGYLKVAKMLGADATLAKPVTAEELVEAVGRVLQSA